MMGEEDGRLLPQTTPHPNRDKTAVRMGHPAPMLPPWCFWVNLCSVASTGISRIGVTRRSLLIALPFALTARPLALTAALAFALAGFPAAARAQSAPLAAAQSTTAAATQSAQPAATVELPDAPGVAAAARTEPV